MLILVFTGCKKMDELHLNPNDQVVTNPDQLFTFSVTRGMGSYITNVDVQYWMLMNWTMYFGTLGGVPAGKEYELNSGKDNLWNELYSQALMNAREVVQLTSSDPSLVNKTAIARIWQVYLFQQATDLWGSIPYSDALAGISGLNYSPAYDKQEKIYGDLLDELKNAAALLDQNKSTFAGNTDPIYSGNVTKWRAFANSLRLRPAMRIRFANAARAQQEVSELQSAPMINSNSDNAIFPFNGEIKNPLYEVIARQEDGGKIYPSKFLIDLLKSLNDPRLKVVAEVTALSVIIGAPDWNGVPDLVPSNSPIWNGYATDGSDVSAVGDWFNRQESPGVLMSHAEVCFLQSEAVLAGWWSGDAQQLYENGIRSAIESYMDTTISNTQINTYLNAVPAVTLENIITQKWISFTYQNSYESYAEYRRTGFPVLKKFDGTPIDLAAFPFRLTYPSSEVTLNSVHYHEALSWQGSDLVTTRVWWNQ